MGSRRTHIHTPRQLEVGEEGEKKNFLRQLSSTSRFVSRPSISTENAPEKGRRLLTIPALSERARRRKRGQAKSEPPGADEEPVAAGARAICWGGR